MEKRPETIVTRPDALITTAAIAQRLSVEPETVAEWIRLRQLPATKVGRGWRVRESDLAAWLAAQPHGGTET